MGCSESKAATAGRDPVATIPVEFNWAHLAATSASGELSLNASIVTLCLSRAKIETSLPPDRNVSDVIVLCPYASAD